MTTVPTTEDRLRALEQQAEAVVQTVVDRVNTPSAEADGFWSKI